MKKSLLGVVLTGLCACLAVPARAEPAASADTGTPSSHTVLHVSGRGSVESPPDLLSATLVAHAEGTAPATVQAHTNDMVRRAMGMARGVNGVTAEAGGYNVSQDNSTGPKQGSWTARQTIRIKSRDTDALLALVGRLQGAGLLLNGLDWSLSPEHRKELIRAAEKLAVDDMRQRAQAVAGDLGMKLTAITEVTVNEGMDIRPRMMMARADVAGPVATPESQSVEASVSATATLTP